MTRATPIQWALLTLLLINLVLAIGLSVYVSISTRRIFMALGQQRLDLLDHRGEILALLSTRSQNVALLMEQLIRQEEQLAEVATLAASAAKNRHEAIAQKLDQIADAGGIRSVNGDLKGVAVPVIADGGDTLVQSIKKDTP